MRNAGLRIVLSVILLALGGPVRAEAPVSTYSIVARDPATGDLGVAVQSHWFSVGSVVPWAEAGVGAVATQSFVEVSYGPLGLDMMRAGVTAPQALKALTVADAHPEVRQVAMIDARGNRAARTGESCIPFAGHVEGEGFTVQANLMRSAEVWPAMAAAYRSAEGDLADRMLAALRAAEEAGGDIRGRQSAAMLIVKGKSTGVPWQDTVLSLRIEDSPRPLEELERLLRLHRAYEHANRGDEHIADGDVEAGLTEYAAAALFAPEIEELPFWEAVTLVNSGRLEDALPIFRRVFAVNPDWMTLVPRLPVAGQLPEDEAVIQRILDQRP